MAMRWQRTMMIETESWGAMVSLACSASNVASIPALWMAQTRSAATLWAVATTARRASEDLKVSGR